MFELAQMLVIKVLRRIISKPASQTWRKPPSARNGGWQLERGAGGLLSVIQMEDLGTYKLRPHKVDSIQDIAL